MSDRPPFPFPRRALDAHKGSCGHVIVVAGSRGMTGAAFLAGKAALRSGAGLVTIACPESANAALEIKTTCVMTRPLPETEAGTLAPAALEPLLELVRGRTAVAIGPGLGRHPGTAELVRRLVAALAAPGAGDERLPPAIIDADGLNAFEGQADELAALGGRAVLTPHPGELARLAGTSAREVQGARRQVLEGFVARVGVCTLLKGQRTLVRADERLYVNETGNPGLASGGTGDVLTGVIGGLLGQGLPPYEAACLGAWLHGRAADWVARRTGWAPLIATDLFEGLIEVIRRVEERP